MAWIPTVAGAALVVLTLRDIFHTLFHPSGEGALSKMVSRLAWRLGRRFGPRGRDVAGPLLLVSVVVVWTVLVVVGCALVYWPRIDSAFSFAPPLRPEQRDDVLDAMYLSTVITGTLGFGDIVARPGWLRALTATQGLIGFALLTAALSWVTQIQPVLGRRRALARYLHAHCRATAQSPPTEPTTQLLERLTSDLVAACVDLGQSTATYYFHERDGRSALAAQLPYLAELARRGRASADRDRRDAAGALDVALDDFADLLGARFVDPGPRADVMRRYAEDHGHETVSPPGAPRPPDR